MRKNKGVESFFYVLLSGLAIFIVVGLISLSLDYTSNSNVFSHSENNRDIKYLLNEKDIETTIEEGNIYYFDKFIFKSLGDMKENKKTIPIGNKKVGNSLGYVEIKREDLFTVSNGLFGKETKIFYFNTNEGKKIRVSFVVNRTNRYGRLIIKFNNRVVFNNYTYGGERILLDITKGIKSKNVLEISCESSLPRIWAPTKYEIKDFMIEGLDYIPQEAYIEFELLPEEYDGLRYVELKFNVLDTNEYAPLSFIMNGKKVFEDVFKSGAKPYLVWFYRKDNLRKGINILRIQTTNNAYYDLSNVEVNIYYLGNAQVYKDQTTFEIPSKEYKFIDKNRDILEGVLEINTESINLDKGITFFINGAQYTIHNLRAYAPNYVVFDIDLLKKGINTIAWETEGNYEIKNIKIGIKKKEGRVI